MIYTTYFFGTKLLPFLWVWLDSLHEQCPDIEPVIFYNHVPDKELELIKERWPFAHFEKDDLKNHEWRRKAIAQKPMWLSRILGDEPIYIFDSDLLFTGDFRKVYNGGADVMYTNYSEHETKPHRFVSIGVMSFTPKTRDFIEEWADKTAYLMGDEKRARGAVSQDGSIDQHSFADMLRASVSEDTYRGGDPFEAFGLVFQPVPCKKLNKWRLGHTKGSSILHVFGPYQRWLLENEDNEYSNGDIAKKWLERYKKVRIPESEVDIHVERLS